MGWKSTVQLDRQEAEELFVKAILRVKEMDSQELGELLGCMYGDNPDLPYHGHNFTVTDE